MVVVVGKGKEEIQTFETEYYQHADRAECVMLMMAQRDPFIISLVVVPAVLKGHDNRKETMSLILPRTITKPPIHPQALVVPLV